MPWFKKDKADEPPEAKKVRTEGLWIKCDGCRQIIWKRDLESNLNVCPKCGHHFRIDARARLAQLLDDGQWTEDDAELASSDPLEFVDTKPYSERLAATKIATGLNDALITAEGKLAGRPVIACAMEYRFIGGSMGSV
ncbi:MAG TPA: acetyl-CoA carboxylase carboxyl transferase subunit beta, partial [Bryobacterales bacterium]|nr:acetyl-CoA carboxylase carboxyl transferase subunit beta [Bryobacterales bacterium]